jgi:hypothetical protein
MSAFGAPAGPHIGRCENLNAAGWYCSAPVLSLGTDVPTDRDICGGCRMHSEAFRQRLLAAHLAGFEAEPEAGWAWVDTAQQILVDMDLGWFDRAARGASMAELTKIRADIRYRENLLAEVLAVLPPRVDTLQSAL